ncbi:MAG: sugar isomerase domain-containing protein [Pirellulaceae bacterium]|nr:sugar isomerase domain-containing protein [Pirellulaceae bacterium]
MTSPLDTYFAACRSIMSTIEQQSESIDLAAGWFAESILAGRLVHLFGGGHSRIMVEEMWPRYGSYPGFHPIVELSLTFHNAVVGANGQRQAMFLENRAGLAARILRNFEVTEADSALVVSSSGCNVVATEIAELFQQRGVRVVALVSKSHCDGSRSNRDDGRKLPDFADLVLDTGAPLGDAMVHITGLDTPVAPGSSIGGCTVVNALKVAVAELLTRSGNPPRVLTAAAIAGSERATELFESAYDEHARRVAKLHATIGATE